MTFEAQHHSRMLADSTRLSAYCTALERVVRREDTVVDVGTGAPGRGGGFFKGHRDMPFVSGGVDGPDLEGSRRLGPPAHPR